MSWKIGLQFLKKIVQNTHFEKGSNFFGKILLKKARVKSILFKNRKNTNFSFKK